MSIILLAGQTEIDDINNKLDQIASGWNIETFKTPIDVGRSDKPLCVIKSNVDEIIRYANKNGMDTAELELAASQLEFISYDMPLWTDINKFIPTMARLIMAPVDSFQFVLEGSSSPSGKWTTVATKIAIPTNTTPALIPVDVHVVSLTFVNETDGANEDFEIYVNGLLSYTWQLRNARWAVLNAVDEFTPLLVIPARSLVSVRIVNFTSPMAQDGILNVFFRMAGSSIPGEFTSATL